MQLKELEDFDWFPAILRQYQMELIGFLVSKLGFYDKVVPIIKNDLEINDINKIVDLCSGSGLPAVYIHQKIGLEKLRSTLTDKYPQAIQSAQGINYHLNPVNVPDVQMEKDTYYTMYNAFHHFETEEQQNLIQNVLNNNGHLMIVEIVQPTFLNVFLVTLASTLGVWLICPLIRPFDWKRMFFTYVIPVNVLTVLLDGYISIIKSKSANQYKASMRDMFKDTPRIKVDSHWSFPAYLVTIKISSFDA